MSRIGNRVLNIPAGVTVKIDNNTVTVKGNKGELSFEVTPNIVIAIEEDKITITRTKEDKKTREMHGTTNALIANMIKGVSEGFSKGLEIIGVGYRFNVKPKVLTINAGYSHPVNLDIPSSVTVNGISNTEIVIEGIDKCQVGEFAANVRKVRPPEPYKGKGIRYKDEHVRRKEGKKDK
ncbi:MAG: 50S ribosomal protein L6 [bacterium]|nr:50S ribosomal protein L6 [bacterium]